MKKSLIKKIVLSLGSLKVLLGLGAVFVSGSAVDAAVVVNNPGSPLLSQTQSSQFGVAKLVDAIKLAANGNVSPSNIQAAVTEAIASNQGSSPATLAAALNQMGLEGQTLVNAINGGASSFDVTASNIVSAMITDAYMTGGKSAAQAKISALRQWVPADVMNDAVANTQLSSAEQLAALQPASGDADTTSSFEGPYNG